MCDVADPRRRRAGQLLRQGAGPRRRPSPSATRRRCSPAASRRSSTTSDRRSSPAPRSPTSARRSASAVMRHGKDFLSDKPAMTTLAQLAEVRKVQAETTRIYSVMYSERHENRATVKAGELVQAGAIGKVIQTVGLGPHRDDSRARRGPTGSTTRSSTAASSPTSPRTSSISSCSSPARPRPRSSRRRSATCTTPTSRASRISATA